MYGTIFFGECGSVMEEDWDLELWFEDINKMRINNSYLSGLV